MAFNPVLDATDAPAADIDSRPDQRVERMRRRYQTGPAYISIERATYYTEAWRQTEGTDLSLPVRVALAMKNVYEKMTHYVDSDDRIAGYWTEFFLGIPIDIERGIFNAVLSAELTKKSMVAFRARALAKGFLYLVKKGALREFLRNQRAAKASGSPPLNMGFDTMSERSINPFQIKEEDRSHLLRHLLPYWNGKTMVDRLERGLREELHYSQDMRDFITAMPGNTSRQVLMLSTCATAACIQGHVILSHEKVLNMGLKAMREEVRERRDSDKTLHKEEKDFLDSLLIAMDGVMIFAQRLIERLEESMNEETDPDKRRSFERMLSICQRVPFEKAETFDEAVQSLWTVKTAVEVAHPVDLHCFGRLDQILYPYYKRDLETGKISPSSARELLEELLLKIMSQNVRAESNILGNFYHRFLGSSPVTLSGVTPDGEDATNDLTYLFLEAAHNSRAIANISVRIHSKTPDEVLHRVADYLHEGTSSFSLFNDEINIEAMKRRGFAERDARDYAVMGCVELTCPGKTGSMSANALLLSRLLDITLRNGDAKTMAGLLRSMGPRTGEPESFETFEDFLAAFLEQGRHFIKRIVDGSNLRDRLYAEHLPAPFISAFIEGCLEKKRDVTRGGGRYDISGISMINSIANLTDSLLVIKRLVFEEKRVSLRDLLEATDHNYEGYEEIFRDIQMLSGKWGNGEKETDALAHRVMKTLFEETYPHRTYKGGPFVVYVISMITHTVDGRLSIASPDGRKAATPFAASCNPANVDRSGVTAVLRSVASLPLEDVMGCAVNVKFHPSAIGDSPDLRSKWVDLIRTYFQIGGSQIQPTVVSADALKRAQVEPESYRDLIVKVGGYSTYFVDLGREIQEEIIQRTEHR